jgi:hypothetical protein
MRHATAPTLVLETPRSPGGYKFVVGDATGWDDAKAQQFLAAAFSTDATAEYLRAERAVEQSDGQTRGGHERLALRLPRGRNHSETDRQRWATYLQDLLAFWESEQLYAKLPHGALLVAHPVLAELEGMIAQEIPQPQPPKLALQSQERSSSKFLLIVAAIGALLLVLFFLR